jgi:hypothetical protein
VCGESTKKQNAQRSLTWYVCLARICLEKAMCPFKTLRGVYDKQAKSSDWISTKNDRRISSLQGITELTITCGSSGPTEEMESGALLRATCYLDLDPVP